MLQRMLAGTLWNSPNNFPSKIHENVYRQAMLGENLSITYARFLEKKMQM